MKKITVRALAGGCLFAAALNCFALKQEAPPSPVETASGTPAKQSDHSITFDRTAWENVFVGHYGEVLRLSESWTAEPEMQDIMEVVRFHERTLDPRKLVSPPYQPKPEEYVPRNFAPMHLAQLFVIPKNAPDGFRSLRKLRAAKEKELAASGLSYKTGPLSWWHDQWPQDSFWVDISTPYQLFQQYTQSDKNFFILTAGVDPNDPAQGYDVKTISDSLQKYLEPFVRQVSEDYLVYRYPRFAIPWLVIVVTAGVLGLLPKRDGWRSRLRLAGRTTFVFCSALPVLGLLTAYLGLHRGLDKWCNSGSVLLCVAIIMPFLCTALSAWLDGKRLWRVFLWMAGINLLPGVTAFVAALDYVEGIRVADGSEYMMASLTLTVMGLLCGICFGLAHAAGETNGASDGVSR